jgi:16S rRNA (cytidine1402-2'-O)-methyltransferase
MRESTPHSNDSLPWKDLTRAVELQDWPASALYVVATPIGNLADLSLRASYALQQCDIIAAEDTRATRVLLQAWGIGTPLMAAHRHNEAQAAQGIIERLQQGQRVALVSDAGAPGVSDPGARVVRAVRQAGFRVIPLPGPSAVIAALMASGATSDENPAFVFAGFVPPKAVARRRWIARWCALAAPVVMYESPHRLHACVADLLEVCGPDRELTLARELTKRFEQVHTGPLGQMPSWLEQDAHRCQGEFVLIMHEAAEQVGDGDALPAQALAMLDALLPLVSVRDAAKVVAKTLGLSRDKLYAAALQRGKSA